MLLVKSKEAGTIGLVQLVTAGKTSLLADDPNWPSVDPIVVALPASVFTLVLVPDRHLRNISAAVSPNGGSRDPWSR